jgi:type I restriction enzyme S subunit
VERLRFSILSNPVRSEVAHWKDDELVSFVPMEAVGEQGSIDVSQERPVGDVYTGYTYFSEQDILVAKITPCFENGKGAIAAGLKNGVGFGTTEFHVLRPLQDIFATWLFYLTMSDGFRKIGGSEMLGAGGQKRVQEDFIKNFRTGIPSLAEQQNIAAFLDWKTEQIDALIAKKKELMEKLKEKRLAVIIQAVTKGLNPAARMRDSGIPWIGTVPTHWGVKPVKYLTKILRGQFSHRPRNDPAFYDGEYPFVQTGDIARAGKYVTEYSQTLNERGLSVSRQFPAGTLVMTIAANIGDMAIIDFPACFPDSIVGFIPEADIDLDFLYYMFIAMKQRLMMTAVLNTQLNLNIDRISSIETVAPPHDEQKNIVALLDKEMERSELLMNAAESAIARLTEYRTALITAATTGKIDVRKVAVPAQVQQRPQAILPASLMEP